MISCCEWGKSMGRYMQISSRLSNYFVGDCSITFPELRKYCLQWKVWKTQFTTHEEISRLAESSKALEMRRSVTRWRQQLALLREETPVALILIFKLCCIRSRCIYCYIFYIPKAIQSFDYCIKWPSRGLL